MKRIAQITNMVGAATRRPTPCIFYKNFLEILNYEIS
jgi:hypothetical protein